MSEPSDATASDRSSSAGTSESDRSSEAQSSLSDSSKDTLSRTSESASNTNAEPSAQERAAGQDRMSAMGQPASDRVARELKQDDTPSLPSSETSDPDIEQVATSILEANTRTRNNRGGRPPSRTVDMQGIAEDVVGLSREAPERASEVYKDLSTRVDAGALKEAVDLELEREHLADAALLGSATPEAIDPAEAEQVATDLIDDVTNTRTFRGGGTRTTVDVNELAYDIEALAKENPSLAVAVRDQVAGRLDASQVSDLNRMISGNATWEENIDMALSHPGQGLIGAGKGIVNGFSALGEMFVKGSAMQAAGQQYQAAGMSSLMGMDEQAQAQIEMGDALHDAALTTDFVPEMPISNRAQAGGELIGMAIDVAMAGKGLITGGAKVLARNADELAGIGARNADELAGVGIRTADDLRWTGGRGQSSGRTYDPTQAGGPIQNLDWKQTDITASGLEDVRTHLSRFEADPANDVMLDRLDRIAKGEIQPTDYDLRFYSHETRELERYRNLGVADDLDPGYDVWNNAHTATLEDFGLKDFDEFGQSTLYHPSALD